MSIGADELRPNEGATHAKKRVGRGNGSGHGTYAGRGVVRLVVEPAGLAVDGPDHGPQDAVGQAVHVRGLGEDLLAPARPVAVVAEQFHHRFGRRLITHCNHEIGVNPFTETDWH